MSVLSDPDSYDGVVFRYGLTALYRGGDLQLENGDLALTKDGDLRLGSVPYNAMFRLVQSWRFNAPAMRLMFDTVREMRSTRSKLEKNLEEILARGPARGRFLQSTDVPLYHAANDAIGAADVSRAALAGSLMIVLSSLLGRFKNDLDANWTDWNTGSPSYASCSVGQTIAAAANSFRHADEWIKVRFANKKTTEQQRSMDVLRSVLGLQSDSDPCYAPDTCEAVLELISGGDFDRLAKATLIFANGLVLQAETRTASR
jgi:hypothetical protein